MQVTLKPGSWICLSAPASKEVGFGVLSGIDSIWDISDVTLVCDDILAISAGNVTDKAADLHSDKPNPNKCHLRAYVGP